MTRLIFATVLTLASAAQLSAQPYPTSSVKFVVPFPAGGGTDFVSRILSEHVGRDRGWTIVVENRPGAGGNLGLAQIGRAPANGSVVGMGQTSNLAINPTLYETIPYNVADDFTPIALISTQPIVVVVAPGSPIRDLSDLVEAARLSPGELAMSTPGAGTVSHLGLEMFAALNDLQFLHIPYPGASQAVTDAMGGHVDFASVSLPSALSQIRSGSVRAIAVTSAERNEMLPDVPTFVERGFEGFDVGDWKAVVGPAGLPEDVVEAWNSAVNEALLHDGFLENLRNEGSVPVGGTAEELREFMRSELERWSSVVMDVDPERE